MDAYHLELFAHVGLGTAALASFWIAALAKKGSAPHKLAGKFYVLVMIGLLVPAVPLTWRALLHFDAMFGIFLYYLLLITATALWRGWTAVRRKRDFDAYARNRSSRLLAWANIGAGAAILGMGLATAQPVFMGFSTVGILVGRGMLQLYASGPTQPRWWMEAHINAMLGCGVATHIAFLLIGLPHLLPASWNSPALATFCWLAPLGAAALARVHLARKYLRAPAQSPRTISPVSTLRSTP